MKQQEILQELRRHGGSLAVAAANEIETLAANNAELDKSLGALTTAYNELLDHMPEWISVKDHLPKAKAAYVRAFDRMLDERRRRGKMDGGMRFGETGEDVMHWWMEDGVLPGQMVFEGMEDI